jgi:hypothetical protein
VAALAAEPAVVANAVLDPLGAARLERSIMASVAAPRGLAALAAKLERDGLRLEAVVAKEQLVDDFPMRQVETIAGWLATAPIRLSWSPSQTLRAGHHDVVDLGNAVLGYLSPLTEPLLAVLAPSPMFRAGVLARRSVSVDPVFGLPLRGVGAIAPEGPGYVSVSSFRPSWSGTAPNSLATVMHRVAGLEHAPDASLAIERVVGVDGVARYVVELPGMRHMGAAPDPQDLTGAISAVAFPSTAYTRCVAKALDAARVPPGADVMLVGHSEGGIVAMDLAGDSAFNGRRVNVTHVVVAGSPVSSKRVAAASATKVFSVENVNDIVTHLDAVDSADSAGCAGSAGSVNAAGSAGSVNAAGSAGETPARLTYQFSADRHDIVGTHDPDRYAERIERLADSPNPLYRQFEAGARPYLSGTTTTSVFKLADRPPT